MPDDLGHLRAMLLLPLGAAVVRGLTIDRAGRLTQQFPAAGGWRA